MRNYKKITDNQKIIKYLFKAADCDKLSHAYIINGIGQDEKKGLMEYILGALLCDNMGARAEGPCGKCAACAKVLTDNHPDIVWVKGEKKDVVSVNDIRNQIVNDIQIKPYYGKHKMYVIENADKMTVNAQNALLKTMEEPPEYATIFLLTENADILLDTIRSRCVKMNIERTVEDTTGERYQFWIDIVKKINKMKVAEIVELSEAMEKGHRSSDLEILKMWFRDVLLCKIGMYQGLFFDTQRNTLIQLATRMSYENINNIINEINETESRLKASVKEQAAMECLLLNLRRNMNEKEKKQW